MQTGNTNFIYKNELDKACFQHDMAYGKSKDLAKRTKSDKVLRNKAFKIASDYKKSASLNKSSESGITNEHNQIKRNKAFKIASDPKYDGYHQRGLASMVYKFFDKKSASLNKSS